jgi:2-polyprenyl-3-methyl-5-hydroxy-6-metoxy-1,4-benzoquinol methylase
MKDSAEKTATLANQATYDSQATKGYASGAPHIKHASLRSLYSTLVARVFNYARTHSTSSPEVLDLGAGEGGVTRPFLELGARVVAVDISGSQLDELRIKCEKFADRLETKCQDINEFLAEDHRTYDIIVTNSFLHHIPDYLALIKNCMDRVRPEGQFFSFQDPIRYDSLGMFTSLFCNVAYFTHRIFQGDIIGGLKRRQRRKRGIYLPDSSHDNTEYHCTRNGVDQDEIERLFIENGFDCDVIRYFSTQNSLFQFIGERLGLKSSFGIIAKRRKIDQ